MINQTEFVCLFLIYKVGLVVGVEELRSGVIRRERVQSPHPIVILTILAYAIKIKQNLFDTI